MSPFYGIVCETPIGNVLMVKGDEIIAAPPHLVLDGISQRITRGMWTLPWREARFTVAALLAVDEVFLVGSAFGVAPVSRIGGTPRGWDGPAYRRLQEAWNEATGTDIPASFLQEG